MTFAESTCTTQLYQRDRVGSRNTVSIYGGGFRVGEGGGVCVLARWGGRVWVLGGWVGGVSAGVWAGRALGGLRAIVFASVVLRRLLVVCVRARRLATFRAREDLDA